MLAWERSLAVTAWDKLVGFYHQLPGGFSMVPRLMGTQPHPSGTFTSWLAQSCSRSRVPISRNWEFSPKGWSGLPRHPRGSAGETPARRIPFGSRQQLIN